MQEQLLKRTCDNPRCDTVQTVNPRQMNAMQKTEGSNWIVLTREHFIEDQVRPINKMGCCSSCAVEIIRNGLMDLPSGKVPATN